MSQEKITPTGRPRLSSHLSDGAEGRVATGASGALSSLTSPPHQDSRGRVTIKEYPPHLLITWGWWEVWMGGGEGDDANSGVQQEEDPKSSTGLTA